LAQEFKLQPSLYIKVLQLPIIKPTILSIDLPDLSKSDFDYEQWLRGDLVVKDVDFRELDDPGYDLGDRVEYSTILKGEIRMGERSIKVEKNQFILPKDIGIESLKSIEIKPSRNDSEVELRVNGDTVEVSKPPEGLEVRIAGQAKYIQVGLDPRFPINSLQSNLPTKLGLSNEIVIAIVSFVLGVIISLFSWLSNDFKSWLPKSRKFDGYTRSNSLRSGNSKNWLKKSKK
jgi:hypothetical protein